MSEIRTCEDYVVARVQDLEHETEELRNELKLTKKIMKCAMAKFDTLRENIQLEGNDNEGWKFNLSAWQKYDKAKFAELADCLGYVFDDDGKFVRDEADVAENFINDVISEIMSDQAKEEANDGQEDNAE